MSGASDLALLGRVVGGLIVVLVLVGLAAKVARRTRGTNGDSGLRIVERIGLSREANLAVVEVSSRRLLLGVTAQGVTMLADLDDAGRRDDQRGNDQRVPVAALPDARVNDELAVTSAGSAADRLVEESEQQPEQPNDDERPTPLPTVVPVDEYPDLASALRAAGRTAAEAGVAEGEARTDQPVPRTRAEARALRAATAPTTPTETPSRESISSRPAPPPTPAPPPPATGNGVPKQRTQASGSVLSPRTWRQGIEALRELTIRRG